MRHLLINKEGEFKDIVLFHSHFSANGEHQDSKEVQAENTLYLKPAG